MNAKHTPGPWASDDTRTHYSEHVIRNNGMLVCRMLDLGFSSHGDREANARLIAKAPEMHAALGQVIGYVRHALDTHNPVQGDAMPILRALALLAEIDGGAR